MMGNELPWMKFEVSKWEQDDDLCMCSPAARGIWIGMLCLMWRSECRGYLMRNGRAMTPREISVLLRGVTVDEVTAAVDELVENRVCSITDEGVYFNRKMVREQEDRDHNAERMRDARGANDQCADDVQMMCKKCADDVQEVCGDCASTDKDKDKDKEIKEKDKEKEKEKEKKSEQNEGFEEWWQLFVVAGRASNSHKATKKEACRSKWRSLIANRGQQAQAIAHTKWLIATRDPKFCPMTTTYLNAGDWVQFDINTPIPEQKADGAKNKLPDRWDKTKDFRYLRSQQMEADAKELGLSIFTYQGLIVKYGCKEAVVEHLEQLRAS